MASFTKHLSTHLYFHMERSGRKQSGTSGFHQSDPHTSSIGQTRVWNKENDRLERRNYEYFSHYEDSPTRQVSSDRRDSIMGREWPEDYFSYSPYLLTPDLSSKLRSRRRTSRRQGRYEPCEDEDDDFGHPMVEPPRMRPPEPTSPALDRRLLPHTPETFRIKDSRGDLASAASAYVNNREEDCFIIPAHMRGRFLPLKNERGVLSSQEMNTLEVADSKVCIVIDFRENGSFASQDLPFPSPALRLTPKEWLVSQLNRHRKVFQWVKESETAIEGLLLMNVERHSQFPFVTYLVTNTLHTDPRRLIVQLRSQSIVSQVTEHLQHTASYEEVATIAKPSFDYMSKKPLTSKTGYIISAFRVFPGEDRAELERNWLIWTGAQQMYRNLPKHLGLRRLTFHKKTFPDGGITYVLMCECAALVEHVTEALVFVDHLRARCCGYTALYKPVEVF